MRWFFVLLGKARLCPQRREALAKRKRGESALHAWLVSLEVLRVPGKRNLWARRKAPQKKFFINTKENGFTFFVFRQAIWRKKRGGTKGCG
jgi:hypothetical protein